MRIHDVGPNEGAVKKKKRLGRGPGSGLGKTAGRGHNGQKSRAGYSRRWGFEGGQMPLVRRLPKRGFTNIFREEMAEVNVGRLGVFPAGQAVTPDLLAEKGLLRRNEVRAVKLLGKGEIDAAVHVHVHAVSKAAKLKIEAAGGSVELIGSTEKAAGLSPADA